MAEAPVPHQSVNPTHAIRLTFEYDGDNVRLVSQQRVEMTLPASDPVRGHEGQKGFWYELRDEQNQPLYRRVTHNPMRSDVEVFSDDPAKTVSRQAVPMRKGVFVAVVPDHAQGQDVVLSASPPVQALVAGHAREIARVRLAK